MARVAGFVIDTVVDLLRIRSPRTVGAKFDVLMPFSRWSEIQAEIGLSFVRRLDDEEAAGDHVRYGVGSWEGSVMMTESKEGINPCDLDFFRRNSYLIPGEDVTFFSSRGSISSKMFCRS